MGDITTIIFDIGRTLVALHTRGEKFGRLMRAIGVEPSQAMRRFWNAPEVLGHSTGKLDSPAFYRAVRDRFGLDHDFDAFKQAWCDIFEPMPGMESLFTELSGGRYAVGLLSDTDPLHWERLQEIMPCLATVKKPTFSYAVGQVKPHPAMYRAAAADCGSEPAHCLFIDDLAANVDGARACGMAALQFTGADALRRDLVSLGLLEGK
ncbi:MAG: HAD family phosphatase [Planctomycetaceae bacterium]|nr:HAD family phosphatase [Planctomycetaceae bacterium]